MRSAEVAGFRELHTFLDAQEPSEELRDLRSNGQHDRPILSGYGVEKAVRPTMPRLPHFCVTKDASILSLPPRLRERDPMIFEGIAGESFRGRSLSGGSLFAGRDGKWIIVRFGSAPRRRARTRCEAPFVRGAGRHR